MGGGTFGLWAAINDVREFHDACDIPTSGEVYIDPKRVDLRRRILEEEWAETDIALEKHDLIEIADGLADIIYIAIGTALEFGIPLDRVWAEVHRSNMAKVDAETGRVVKRDDGKILKPEGWTAPDIAGVLGV